MTFRLRVFALVMLIAVTAIGATAWLTLSLTARAIGESQANEATHQNRIIEEVRQYGLRRGRWPGVDQVVVRLSRSTGLHIRLQTPDGSVLADSDHSEGRRAGRVRSAPLTIDPQPAYVPGGGRVTWPADGVVRPSPGLFESPAGAGGPVIAAVRQVAQYRAALIAVRCIADKEHVAPALLTDRAPYLTPAQRSAYPRCVSSAVDRVRTDISWLRAVSKSFAPCIDAFVTDEMIACVRLVFVQRVGEFAALPLRLYLGFRDGREVTDLGSPALAGVAGLILVALAGSVVIARRVARPVWRLTMASLRLADGNLDVRVPAKGRGDLAVLSASFNAMAQAVQNSEERQRRLIADVAHEMRTPLSNLRGYLEGLSDGVVEPSRELFVSLHEETLLQGRILDDLQQLVEAEAGDLTYTESRFDLAALAATSATAHRAAAEEAGIELVVDAPEGCWVRADPERLRQVAGNLLSNAIRYTDRGGRVRLTVHASMFEGVLIVQDTGVGIAAEDVPRVFDRFWRADPARQRATGGTGLGLTIAHRIVADHGGRIEVASTLGAGSTFTVRLPLNQWGATGADGVGSPSG